MTLTKTFCTALFAAALPLTAQAASFFELEDSGASTIDTASPTSFDLNVTTTGTISDLNLLLSIGNPFRANVFYPGTIAWGDLNVSLSKDGVTANLWSAGNPGENDSLFVAFDDESTEDETLNDVLARTNMLPGGAFEQSDVQDAFLLPRPASDGDLPETSYRPEDPLSIFDGMELSGTWTLTFFDSVVPNEGDILGGWQLYGTTAEPAPVPLPASLPLLLAGLGGLAMWGRRKKACPGRIIYKRGILAGCPFLMREHCPPC